MISEGMLVDVDVMCSGEELEDMTDGMVEVEEAMVGEKKAVVVEVMEVEELVMK
jgi:hypothetical protein